MPILFFHIRHALAVAVLFCALHLSAQSFIFGSDLSYVNQMDDCGVVYKDNSIGKDPYEIFASHGTNVVRLRLWHTPSWFDNLDAGNRYSDFTDVRHGIMRAKGAGMQVLLDFHLSDTWADPAKQIIPAAWLGVVNSLPALQDSLYNYIFETLTRLDAEGLLPEMVQIGNETNRGILQTAAANTAGWQLDWPRNSALFKKAITAVRDAEAATGKNIKVALHVAGPADAGWLMDGFWNNGVKDFDVIGISYYWAWHKPTTIAQTGNIIAQLKTKYPGKEVMIFETGYIWTMQNIDGATNIINEVHPEYAPASPQNQLKWMTDLTQEVINKGGTGVMYWEPAWVSSPCHTPWGQGSHQEHATFFDFNDNVLPEGGMLWPEFNYQNLSGTVTPDLLSEKPVFNATVISGTNLTLEFTHFKEIKPEVRLYNSTGNWMASRQVQLDTTGTGRYEWPMKDMPQGVYFLLVQGMVKKIWLR